MTAASNADGVLSGFTVVELGGFYAVPAATAYLADLGARVVKVEDPDGGDPMRHGHRWAGGNVPFADDTTLMFAEINRGKDLVAVDVADRRGREVFGEILDKADVFVTNLRRPALERFGIWYDQLPDDDLVYVHLSGYGPVGPERDDPAFDMVAQAKSGLMSLLGRDGEPFTFHLAVDQLAAVSTAWATCIALLGRAAGRPIERLIQTSLVGSAIDFMRIPLLMSAATGADAAFPPRSSAPVPTLNAYRCADGQWIALSVGIAGDVYWPRLCTALQLDDTTRRAYVAARDRQLRAGELIGLLDARFAAADGAHWMMRLRDAGFPCSVVSEVGAVCDDPQVRLNALEDCAYAGYGTFPRAVLPIGHANQRFGERGSIDPKPVGADTRSLLVDELGLSSQLVHELISSGVLGSGRTPSNESKPLTIEEHP